MLEPKGMAVRAYQALGFGGGGNDASQASPHACSSATQWHNCGKRKFLKISYSLACR